MHDRRLAQREAIRGLGPDVFAVEPYLRDRGSPSGLFRVSPDVAQADLGIRHRSRVVRAIAALAGAKMADGSAVLVYDEQLFVGYFPGSPGPSNHSQCRSRLKFALSMPDCQARRVALQELAPFVRRFDADKPDPTAEAGESGQQQQLPGVGQQAGAPAPATTPAPTTDAGDQAPAAAATPAPVAVATPEKRAGVEQLTAQLAGKMDPSRARPAEDDAGPWWRQSPAAPIFAAYRKHLAGLPQPDDRWRPGRPLHAMLLQRWQQAADAGEAGEWDRYFDFVASRLDVRGCIKVGGRPQLVSFEMLLQGQVLRELWSAARDVQRGDTGADPPDSAAA